MSQPLAECAPPRLLRALSIEVLLIVAFVAAAQLIHTRAPAPIDPPPQRAPPKPREQKIRVLRLPKPKPVPQPTPAAKPPPPAKAEPAPPPRSEIAKAEPPKRPPPAPQPTPPPAPPKLELPKAPPSEPPKVEVAKPEPPPKPEPEPVAKPQIAMVEPPKPAPAPKPPVHAAPVRIAADSREVHGVRLRVLVPSSPSDLEAHLRSSGGCLVVSRLDERGAEVLSVLGINASRAYEQEGPPCAGVPRLLNDESLNAALGDPLGRARAEHPGERLALQVLLTPELPGLAQQALRARFGDLPDDELARRAGEANYELTCFAEPEGQVRCE